MNKLKNCYNVETFHSAESEVLEDAEVLIVSAGVFKAPNWRANPIERLEEVQLRKFLTMSRRLEHRKAGRKVKTPILGDELVTSFYFLYRKEAAYIGLAGQRRICYPCPVYGRTFRS